jgi:replication factor A1
MEQIEIETAAQEVVEQLDQDVDQEEIEEKIRGITEYSIPVEQAKRNVLSNIKGEDQIRKSPNSMKVGDVDRDGEFVSFEKVEVIDTWDGDNFKQKGKFADEDNAIEFVIFEDTPVPTFDVGDVVRVEGAQTSEWNGKYSVKIFESTNIEHLDEDIDTDKADVDVVQSPVVNIADDSGLVYRCVEEDDGEVCGRIVRDGSCYEHGEGETEFDIRIKGDLDDGDSTLSFYINDNELIEEVVGLSFEEFEEIFQESNYRREATINPIEDEMLMQYYEMRGNKFDGKLFVESIDELSPNPQSEAESLKDEIPLFNGGGST